jgi:hypothetical protein
MPKPVQFRLKNSLNATLYFPESVGTKRLIKLVQAHANPHHMYPSRSALTLVKVKVEEELVYLVYWVGQYGARYVVEELRTQLENPENGPSWIVYANEVYAFTEPSFNAFYGAVVQNIKLCLAPLITPQADRKTMLPNKKRRIP